VEQPDNQLVLTGRLLKAAEVRTTPAGIPISRFLLEHQSSRSEGGQMRRVACRMPVVASGASVTALVADQPPGAWLKVTGFVSRAGYRAPETRIELHALTIETVAQHGQQER
jgi:primosomal replication protein N